MIIRVPISTQHVRLTMLNYMTQQQFNDLLHALRKEVMSNMIKTAIRQQFPEPLAS